MYDFKQEFVRQLAILERQIHNAKRKLEILENKLTEAKDFRRREDLKEQIFFMRRFISMCMKEQEFLRVGTEEDYSYRSMVLCDFASALRGVLGNNSSYRFHGTSIYFAREIIDSGEISCIQDRSGYSNGFDLSGHISVTTKDNIEITLADYMSLTDFCMPAGCVFVLQPSEEDGSLRGFQMKKVDFKQNPDVLFAIITTPENLPRVKDWCRKAEIAENKVCDFLEFLNMDFTKPAKKLDFYPI